MANSNNLPSKSDKLTSMLLIEIHNKLIDIEERLNEKSEKEIQQPPENIKSFLEQLIKVNTSILKELKDGADEGEFLVQSGTVTTTEFTIIDTDRDPGHPVKGYFIQNTGLNDIQIVHNAALSSVGPDIVDINSDITRFSVIEANEVTEFTYNRKKIRNIYLLSSGGNSTYKVKLVW